MQALALLLFLQLQPGQHLKDWKVQRREPNPKTGVQEIVAFVEGDEAVPVVVTREKEVFDITGLRLRYFTDPRKPGDPSEEVRLRSDTARLDNEKDRVDLAGHVHAEKNDGTTLDAPEATLTFRKKFVCPDHDVAEPKPGRCPVCATELKSRTFTTIEALRTFVVVKPETSTRLTGEGLSAGDDLRRMRIERDGFLTTSGTPRELGAPGAPPAPSTARPSVTEMRSSGPMTFTESSAGIQASAEKDVRVRRIETTPDDRSETTIVTADAAELLARRAEGPDRKKEPSPERLTAAGGVVMESRDATARGDRLVWDRTGDGEDVAILEGTRASVESAGSRVEAKTVTLQRLLGISTFRDDVAAVLQSAGDPGGQPLKIRSRILVSHAAPGGKEFSDLEALGDVRLEGLGQGQTATPGVAEADRFTWSQTENHGLLERRPFVRVVQEDSTVYAPRIVLEGRSTVILKGPKLIVMTQKDAEGKESRTSATADADIVLDSSGEKTVIRLRDRCAVRTPDVQLFADRMTLRTASGGQGLDTLNASGHVRAIQLKEGATLFGEWLDFKPKTETSPQVLTLTGAPLSIIDTGRTTSIQEQVLVREKIDPVTGEKTSTQEMRGGRHGVRIVIEER